MYQMLTVDRKCSISTRSYLALLALCLMLPILIFVTLLLNQQIKLERSRIEQDLLKESRSITATIERDLRGVTSMVETLAQMPTLQQGDFEAFHQQASQITSRYGIGIVLNDLAGRQQLNTRVPWNTPLPAITGTDAMRTVLETRAPYVTDRVTGAVSRKELVGVVVPVVRGNEVTHFLTASLRLERISDILNQAGVGDGRTATVVDRKGKVLAVIPERGKVDAASWDWIGKAAAREGVAASTHGPGDSRLTSGYSKSGMTGWSTIVSQPGDEIDGKLARDLWSLILVGTAFLVLSGLLAAALGLRIAGAAKALTAAGRALQSGGVVPPVRTSWREANEVGLALTTAFRRLSEKSEALRTAEEQYRTLSRSSPVGIFRTDAEGRCTCVNERWCEIAGARPEQALGNGWSDFLHPDDFSRVFAEWRRSAVENRPFRLEYRFRTPTGAITWVLGEALIERDGDGSITGYIGTITDISENKQLERQLLDTKQQLVRAMMAGGMFAFEWDALSDAVRRSESCGTILGLDDSPQTDTGRNYIGHIHPDNRRGFTDTLTALRPERPNYVMSYRYIRPDGAVAWLEESAAGIFDDGGRLTGLTGITADVTARMAAEAILRDSNTALEARVAERTRALTDAARELSAEIRRREQTQAALLQSQKLEALGQLVSGVSHDFNNVLAVIQSSYSLLRRQTGSMDQAKILDMAEQAVERATGLIHHMMAFARREEAHPRKVDLAAVLRESEDMICHTAGSGIRCVFDIQAELWPSVVDPSRLNAVLLNLAANARDAMADGGELEVSARNLPRGEGPGNAAGNGTDNGGWIVIAVKDTGAGMTPEVVARASEPFFTTKPPGKGTGLGLASAHDFVSQAGGTIRIRSAVGAGTTIELHLPRAALSAEEEEPPLNADLAKLSGSATILVVDADENLRTLATQLLRDFGYTVIEAQNAGTAAALAHISERLDLVITDVALPGASGAELTGRLRLDRPNLPVLFIGCYEQDTGPDGERLLRRPFGRAQLAEAVLERLGRLPKPAAPAAASASAPDKLRDRLRNPGLRDAYDRWKALRNAGGGLPDRDLFPSDDTTMKDNSFMVEPDGTGGYRYVRFGDALAERLGRSLLGEQAGDDGDDLGSAGASYRRCQETGLPSYEYARYSLADEVPLLFERLLLPLSDDGKRVTHLLGVAFFTELPKLDLQPRI
ncbi:hypothetical protein N826_32665 [Skermanella aerolata KACC 11604]|nr:hypothetical protein N826_32665 [Skermanella aerolata KACC 11604]